MIDQCSCNILPTGNEQKHQSLTKSDQTTSDTSIESMLLLD